MGIVGRRQNYGLDARGQDSSSLRSSE